MAAGRAGWPPAAPPRQAAKATDSAPRQGLVELLAPISRPMVLQRGEILFSEGDPGDALYWVETGAVEVSVLSRDGRSVILDIQRAGAVLGEIALFDPGPRSATVTALETARLHRVDHRDVLAALASDPDLALALFRLAGQRMRWMNAQLIDQTLLVASVRLARRLLYLTRQTGDTLTLSQEELAGFAGSTREAVSRALATWRKRGLVDVSRRGLRILDRDGLSAVAYPDGGGDGGGGENDGGGTEKVNEV